MVAQDLEWASTKIAGCYRIKPLFAKDPRGVFCKPFSNNGRFPVPFTPQEVYYSSSYKRVVRGLHIQKDTAKLVTCVKGFIYDVVVDLRPNSPTYTQWVGIYRHENESIFVPAGCAHGFEALDTALVMYVCDKPYDQANDSGIRYDDKFIAVDWISPIDRVIVSPRDKKLPTFAEWRKTHDTF